MTVPLPPARAEAQTRPLNVLTLCDKWIGGGPIAVNREISIALAELGHRVTTRVSVPSPSHPLVDIQVLDPVPGVSDTRAQLLRADRLPADVDVIMGHGRFSGGAASYLRDNFYPHAKVVHFVHVTADEMDRGRGEPLESNQHTETERALVSRADLVVGVGPLLTDEGRRLARMCEKPPPVVQMTPGVILETPPRYDPEQTRLNLLVFTRTDDRLKGADIAAAAVGELHKRGMDVRLTMLGAHKSDVAEQERVLSDIAGFPVRVRGYTSDPSVMAAELRGADMVIHAARHEDFGLAPLEAAGHGVPVLVGNHTGVGMFLGDPKEVPAALGAPSVVNTRGTSEATLPTVWADHAEAVLKDLPEARRRATDLREHLGQNHTWRHAAEGVVENIRTLAPPTRSTTAAATAALQVAHQQTRPPAVAPRRPQGWQEAFRPGRGR
ncbi:glycosyltransferase family 4 protein [Micromonospora sp. MH99]|uniref:glycosyltransferase family 4 protein n=1 Tax=Micromonospora sp. MH99 TaxID=1945510 RepID=UPI001F1F5000|nr:glycosyltransferase family 4 protein [Micromonospora sp. MH99]MCF0092703.1 D-inositol-3-phosphate glycosyltransferase [Micromonospora sp. MH99]